LSDKQSKAWSEFSKAVTEFIPPKAIVETYRIYYNSEGEVTKQVHNEPGDPTGPCLEMNWNEYKTVMHKLHNCIIKDGTITDMPHKVKTKLLKPSNSGYSVMRNNLAFPDDNNPEYWDHGHY
jgi:hypothetical protein